MFIDRLYRVARRIPPTKHELWFIPENPGLYNYTILKVCSHLRLKPMSHPTDATKIAIVWKDATRVDVPRIKSNAFRVLNAGCDDISKRKVGDVFGETFGYPLSIDPTSYYGPAVEKSDDNAAHDGCVVLCPIERKPRCEYTILIDNAVSDTEIQDIRVAVIDGATPLAYLKRRPLSDRFSNTNTSVRMVDPTTIFSASELNGIRMFARAMGLDYGEIDVLRDRSSGLIYAIDVNKTPFGPPNGLPVVDQLRAVRTLARAFRSLL